MFYVIVAIIKNNVGDIFGVELNDGRYFYKDTVVSIIDNKEGMFYIQNGMRIFTFERSGIKFIRSASNREFTDNLDNLPMIQNPNTKNWQ